MINSGINIREVFGPELYRYHDWRPQRSATAISEVCSHQAISQVVEKKDSTPNFSSEDTPLLLFETDAESSDLTPPVGAQAESIVFAIDLEKRDLEELDSHFVPLGESELMLKKMLNALELRESDFRIWTCTQSEDIPDEIHRSHFEKLLSSMGRCKVYCFGLRMAEFFIGQRKRMSEIHGQVLKSHIFSQIQVIPLFHPDYLLINPQMKRKVWEVLVRELKVPKEL